MWDSLLYSSVQKAGLIFLLAKDYELESVFYTGFLSYTIQFFTLRSALMLGLIVLVEVL